MSIEHQTQASQPSRASRGRHAGFTLVELMVVVAVVGILAIVAMPAMTDLINNSRATGQTEELVASLQLARAEAVRRNARVTVCAGTGGVCSGSTSWAQLTVFGLDNTVSPAVSDVIRDNAASGTVQVSGPATGIVFKPSGRIETSQQLVVTMAAQKRYLCVLISGVVSVSKSACP